VTDSCAGDKQQESLLYELDARATYVLQESRVMYNELRHEWTDANNDQWRSTKQWTTDTFFIHYYSGGVYL